MAVRKCNSPITLPVSAVDSDVKAHIHWECPGTKNLQKLNVELKYLGKNPEDAKL